jgi:prepilin-type N-terminal cleavage/methylation domain-containing protein
MGTALKRLRTRRRASDEGGFTLIELVIVLVVVSVLAAIIVVAVDDLATSSAQASCASDVSTVDHAVEAYDAQVGAAPATITSLLNQTGGVDGDTVGPWLHNLPDNGHHYSVTLTADHKGGIVVNYSYSGGSFTQAATFTNAANIAPPTTVTTTSVCSGVS